MIVWINGAFGAGKTTTAFELHRRIPSSFVYDPENVGYFIRKNAPEQFSKGDFQDIPLWRQMNYEMLAMLLRQYDGIIIVPMTVVNKEYHDEIIGKLIKNGFDVRHYILYASEETIIKRLKKRSIGKPDDFGIQSIKRCLYSFDNIIADTKIMTDNKSVDDVVTEIAKMCNVPLVVGKRTLLRKLTNRIFAKIRQR